MKAMKIIDLEGKEIEITDLPLAIMQADDYRHYELTAPSAAELNQKQRTYWEDIYQKLLNITGE